ncbi:MAG: thymidine phosphorylase [Candidatus Eisenbacteria bacterium]|uniref:Thymidine phosphorylase n=1 Tax=Eiseniibacteriota bacterium TaxID=2212470 RepID=A0A538S7C1_UNCEI|nr:MAG: thymidine phosphorylase [Candidatus Eisenbacteria bacterium]TMQ57514.1 MAG: thymidine phosphorylase [Candidatus Eisenbacteria bacterium]
MKDLIRIKRNGEALPRSAIDRWIHGVTEGSIPDYQSAALLMAITLRGMNDEETVALTDAVLHSGSLLGWNGLGRPTVDKHSTGGVGDKISIALAPLVAACGAAVPMIVGRGLGHTGGTRDKLEAIPGFRTALTAEEFSAQVRRIGVVIAGQSEELAPADGKLYALRDVTGTVESRPLIVASILGKKLAAGASGILFDVKCGRGAIMETQEEARELAKDLTRVARELGRKSRAIITSMDQPLGLTIGNASETAEALQILRGLAPPDVTELTRTLGAMMLVLAGVARERHEADARMDTALGSGLALQRAEAMIQAQGGDPRVTVDPGILPRAPVETKATADRKGYVTEIDARALGMLLVRMGGGRERMDQELDHGVGIRLLRKVGDLVGAGDAVAIVEARREAPDWADEVRRAYSIADQAPTPKPLIIEDSGR